MNTLRMPEGELIDLIFDRGWTDGLPVIPPTPDRVAAMLAVVDRGPADILGAVPQRRRVVPVEIAAINSVMAGCRPEYFNIVLTALEAVLDPSFNVNTVVTSTGGAAIAVIVSGPMAAEVGMNCTGNLLGPGNRANATIGRAVHLTMRNALAASTGRLDASSFGHPGKYTLCFAENEPAEPWPSLRIEQGYSASDTTVTVMATEAPRQIANHLSEDPIAVLRSFLVSIVQASSIIVGKGGQGIVVLGHEHALALRRAGWSKQNVRDFLASESRVSEQHLAAGGIPIERNAQHAMTPDRDGRYPTFQSPDDITIVTAGGPGSGWSAYIPAFVPVMHTRAVTRRVRPAGEAMPDCGPDGCVISEPSSRPDLNQWRTHERDHDPRPRDSR